MKARELDCSLQRHHFQMLDESQAKPMNSVLYRNVTQIELTTDLREVGLMLYRALNASAASPFNPPQRHCWGDYVCTSGRTYRVDNVNPAGRLPNHCYPIAGPSVWGNLDQARFDFVRLVSRIVLSGGLHAPLAEIQRDSERRSVVEGRRKLERLRASRHLRMSPPCVRPHGVIAPAHYGMRVLLHGLTSSPVRA